MKVLLCPLNGRRNISEFTYGGEYRPLPDPDQCNDRAWAEHVFFHDNTAGVVIEWWCHTATAFWFLVERNTYTDEIMRTFSADELRNGNGGGHATR